MSTFTPKKYQELTLASVEKYFRTCQQMDSADYAFQETTKELWGRKSDFTPLAGFPEAMPISACGFQLAAAKPISPRRARRW